jgi:hypothetical protein
MPPILFFRPCTPGGGGRDHSMLYVRTIGARQRQDIGLAQQVEIAVYVV